MDEALPLLAWVFGCFALAMVCLVVLLKMLDASKVEAKRAEADPPALRTVAWVDLQPAGAWQSDEVDLPEVGRPRFEALRAHLIELGFAPGPLVLEDWGIFCRLPPWELVFGPHDDSTGWGLRVQRRSMVAISDTPESRQLLLALHVGLKKMEGVSRVAWKKGGEKQTETFAVPFDGAPP